MREWVEWGWKPARWSIDVWESVVMGSFIHGELPPLVWEVALPRWTWYVIWRFSWTQLLLFEDQVAVMARRAFVQQWVVFQLCPFLDQQSQLAVSQALVTSRLNYYKALMGLALKSIWSFNWFKMWQPTWFCASMDLLLQKLHLPPYASRSNFKVLFVTFKALRCLGPGSLKDLLFPVAFTEPIRTRREGMLPLN